MCGLNISHNFSDLTNQKISAERPVKRTEAVCSPRMPKKPDRTLAAAASNSKPRNATQRPSPRRRRAFITDHPTMRDATYWRSASFTVKILSSFELASQTGAGSAPAPPLQIARPGRDRAGTQ